MTARRWAVLVVWKDGSTEYVAQGEHTATFSKKSSAKEVADLFREGGDDDYQSVNVVPAPRAGA